MEEESFIINVDRESSSFYIKTIHNFVIEIEMMSHASNSHVAAVKT